MSDEPDSLFTALYPGEHKLHGDLHVGTLILHLAADPPNKIDLAGFRLTWQQVDLVGTGSFEIWNQGKMVQRVTRTKDMVVSAECGSTPDLVRFADGECDEREADGIRLHLRSCKLCADQVVMLMQMMARLSTLNLKDDP